MADKKTFDVWVIKYCLSKGGSIQKMRVEQNDEDDTRKKYVWTRGKGLTLDQMFKLGRDAFLNKEQAVFCAEKMRRKRIENLKKQIATLEKLSFRKGG